MARAVGEGQRLAQWYPLPVDRNTVSRSAALAAPPYPPVRPLRRMLDTRAACGERTGGACLAPYGDVSSYAHPGCALRPYPESSRGFCFARLRAMSRESRSFRHVAVDALRWITLGITGIISCCQSRFMPTAHRGQKSRVLHSRPCVHVAPGGTGLAPNPLRAKPAVT
jgi:hypothetical protein